MRFICILNKTRFPTGQLRRFIAQSANEVLDEERSPTIRATFRELNRKNCLGVRGFGELRGDRIWIWLPKGDVCKEELALVITRAIGRLKGLTGKDMKGNGKYDWRHPKWKEIYSWALSLPLAEQKEMTVEAKSLQQLAHAQKRMEISRERINRKQKEIEKARDILEKWTRIFMNLEKSSNVAKGMILDQ